MSIWKLILLCFLTIAVLVVGIFLLSYLFVKKNSDENDNQLKSEKLNWVSIGFIALASFILIFSFITPILFTRGFVIPEFDFRATGEIGDTIGGIMNPFIAIVGVIVTGLAFYMQYRANKIQVNLFNKTQTEQTEFAKKQFFIKLIDNLHDRIINFAILNTSTSGGVIGSPIGSGNYTASPMQSFNALDQVIAEIEKEFYKSAIGLGRNYFGKFPKDIPNNTFISIAKIYAPDASAIAEGEKLKLEFLKLNFHSDRIQHLDDMMKLSAKAWVEGGQVLENNYRDIGLTYFDNFDFKERTDFYLRIANYLFEEYGSFLESYINSLTLIVNEVIANKTEPFYMDYFKNNITNNEKLILYYCLISKRMPNSLKTKLVELDFFDENLFTSGNKTFFEFEKHKKEVINLVQIKH